MKTPQAIIGGYACRLPESDSPEEFWRNLIDGRDMVTEDARRWPPGRYDTPTRFGKLKDIATFDARFFGVHAKQAHKMDPQLRLLLTCTYEAIRSAGFIPEELRGSATGVYVGACSTDAYGLLSARPESMIGYENTGCTMSMLANRISFSFDFRGASQTIDTACSSSLVALDAAVAALNAGACEHAVVAGANLLLRPSITAGFARLQMLSPDGVCRAFDANANGYARAEGIVVLFLTRAECARRIVASVLGCGVNNDGYTEQGITFPSGAAQRRLLEEVYARAQIDPHNVTYVEAHGTGTLAGDPQEASALAEVLCRERDTPLLIGSVKSNMGHSEGAAGLTGVLKVLLAMEHGTIPANLHFEKPNVEIAPLHDGRMAVVATPQAWHGGIAAVNSFGFGGTNAHVVLRHNKPESTQPLSAPTVVPIAAHTEAGLESQLSRAGTNELTPGQAALFAAVANAPIDNHPYRGAVVRSHNDIAATIRSNGALTTKPAVWWVFPGMGAQWPQMGQALLELPPCRAALMRCHAAVADIGIDLLAILTQANPATPLDLTATFVGLTAVQIALVDLLRHANVEPDGIIGHSVGEIAAAYADGAFDVEQAIMTAYWRGHTVAATPSARGKMLAVALDLNAATAVCTDTVSVACHNGLRSITLSGDTDAIDTLAVHLSASGVDTRVVDSAGIAFHAPGVAAAAPDLRKALTSLIAVPRARSARWRSTSAETDEAAPLCDADYFVNNLLRPVRFAEALTAIPPRAVVVEIGAHALLRRPIAETRADCATLSLMIRGKHGVGPILEGLARIYTSGIDVAWTQLLGINFPLTAPCHIPALCHWDDTQIWEVPSHAEYEQSGNSEHRFTVDLKSDEYTYIADHAVHGKVLFPAVGYLHLVWRVLAQLANTAYERLPVQFEDVEFHRATPITADTPVTLAVSYLAATRRFEITHDQELVASGTAFAGDVVTEPLTTATSNDSGAIALARADIYKELRLRGYQYGPAFQRLLIASTDGTQMRIDWDGNWVTYMDALLQGTIMPQSRATRVPTLLRRVTIDPKRQPPPGDLAANYDSILNRITGPAVVIEECRTAPLAAPRNVEKPTLQQHVFVPYDAVDAHITDETIEYTDAVKYAVVTGTLALLRTVRANGKLLPAHLLRLEQILARETVSPTTAEVIARFTAHPQGLMLRLAQHAYADPDLLLDNPMARIVGFAEYGTLYRDDLGIANLFNAYDLGVFVDIALENGAAARPVCIAEIGAGTGGLTAHVLAKLRTADDRYVITDISAGFFDNLRRAFSNYDRVTKFAVWDIRQLAPAALRAPALDLIVASNTLHAAPNLRAALAHLHDALSDQGFLLLHECTHGYASVLGIWGFLDQLWTFDDMADRTHGAFLSATQWRHLLEECGFDIVGIRDDKVASTLFLCRKRAADVLVPHRLRLTGDFANDLPAIQAALAELNASNVRLWLEAEERVAPGLLGLLQCIRKEPGGDHVRALLAPDLAAVTDDRRTDLQRLDLAQNVIRKDVWGSLRHLPLTMPREITTTNAELRLETGDLSSIHWVQGSVARERDYEYEARYLTLNFKDIMVATGRLNTEIYGHAVVTKVGGEFSGYTRDGRRVMGFVYEAFSTRLGRGRSLGVFSVPKSWSLAQAATVPVAYSTAYLALIVRARLKSGERVLIHAGSGGVGQAAIRIALSLGCEVFTTVGTPEKRAFLLKEFPQLRDDHIGSSRDISFEALVLKATAGRGVQVVLNSLADDKLAASLRVLGRYGRFVEIGKYDMSRDTRIGMGMFLRDISFFGVGFDNFAHDPTAEFDEVIALVKKGLKAGVVQPLAHTVYPANAVEEAFRYMARGHHIGKVLVRVCDEAEGPLSLSAKPRLSFYPDKSYLITGGLGGVGLELAQWLIERGARRLFLSSRRSVHGAYETYRLQAFEQQGARVTVSTLDVADPAQAEQLVREIESEQALGGVFHLAMVLEDGLITNQTTERFDRVLHPKAAGAQQLDRVTRRYCGELDHFVAFSSVTAGHGNAGQTNYGYANSLLERLCESRRRTGHPAIAIQWGAIGGVGFVEENRARVQLNSIGLREQPIHSCLDALDILLAHPSPVVTSTVPDRDFKSHTTARATPGGSDGLFAAIKGVIGFRPDEVIAPDVPFSELGLDSLMTVEIEHLLKRGHDLPVTLADVRSLTFAKILALYNQHHSGPATADAAATATPTVVIEHMQGPKTAATVVYFVAGMLIEPHAAAMAAQLPDDAAVYLVRYERAGTMSALSEIWGAHVRALPPGTARVLIIGHSIGATIAQRLVRNLGTCPITCELLLVAPPRLELFDALDGVKLEELERMSADETWRRAKQLSFFGDFPMLPLAAVRAQVKFLIADRFFQQPLARPDVVVLPDEDSLCWRRDEARSQADLVHCIPGNHALKSMLLKQYWAGTKELAEVVPDPQNIV